MRPGAAEVQALHGRPRAAAPPRQGPLAEDGARQRLSVEDVPAGEPEAFFEIRRAEYFAVQDRARHVRRVEAERRDHGVARLLPQRRPVA